MNNVNSECFLFNGKVVNRIFFEIKMYHFIFEISVVKSLFCVISEESYIYGIQQHMVKFVTHFLLV